MSLKKLDLSVDNSGTHEALARIFVLQPLEELVLTLIFDASSTDIFDDTSTEVSSACSPGMYVCMYVVVRCGL